MHARLLACLPMVFALSGCDPLGSEGSLPTGIGGISSPPNPLQYKAEFVRTADTLVGVGQGKHFSVAFSSSSFRRIQLTLYRDEGGRAEYLGVACRPTASCGIEAMSPSRMTLMLHSVQELTVHVVGAEPGRVRMGLVADGPPCSGGSLAQECGTAYSSLVFGVVP